MRFTWDDESGSVLVEGDYAELPLRKSGRRRGRRGPHSVGNVFRPIGKVRIGIDVVVAVAFLRGDRDV